MVKIYESRIIPVMKEIKGNDILDIGCVGMGKNDSFGGIDFIHGKLKDHGFNVTGLDNNSDGVKMLNEKGFNIIDYDAECYYSLGKKFDTIISEENIEHISNLKMYLNNIKAHLKDDGIFILTTPNAFCIDFILQHFIYGGQRANLYHTHYHNINTIMHLLEIHGFFVASIDYFTAINKNMNFNSKILKLILPFLPERFGRTMLITAIKDILITPVKNE